MTTSRWFGLTMCFLLAAFFMAGAVWSYVGNTVMMGILVGNAYAAIWMVGTLIGLTAAIAFVPGFTRERMAHFGRLLAGLIVAAVGYAMMQNINPGWPIPMTVASIILAWAIYRVWLDANLHVAYQQFWKSMDDRGYTA